MIDVTELNDLEEAFVECRTYGHAWERQKDSRAETNGEAALTLRCTRCGMTRSDIFSTTSGGLFGRSYKQPEGYKMAGRVNVDALRLELATRYNFIGGRKGKKK